MKKIPVMLGAVLAALAFSACEKRLDEQPQPQAAPADATATKPALLAGGAWHQTGLLVSTAAPGAAPATADLFGHVKPTMLVQSAVYRPDGGYTATYGAQLGAPTPARQVQGRWRLSTNADTLILTLPDHTQRLLVQEISGTALRLAYADAPANGSVSTYTTVFER